MKCRIWTFLLLILVAVLSATNTTEMLTTNVNEFTQVNVDDGNQDVKANATELVLTGTIVLENAQYSDITEIFVMNQNNEEIVYSSLTDGTFTVNFNACDVIDICFMHSSNNYESKHISLYLGNNNYDAGTIQLIENSDKVLNVPGDYSDIQTAIDCIQDGGTVTVSNSTYPYQVSNLNWRNKHIRLATTPQAPAVLTSTTHAFKLDWDEIDNTDEIDGFKFEDCIRQNYGDENYGLAISMMNGASPLVKNCIFEDNDINLPSGVLPNLGNHEGVGSAVFVEGIADQETYPVFTNCTFDGNLGHDVYGGAAVALYGPATFTNCDFTGNGCWRNTGGENAGGAILVYNVIPSGKIEFNNCQFEDNNADSKASDIMLVRSGNLEEFIISGCTFNNTFATSPSNPSINLIDHNVAGENLYQNTVSFNITNNLFQNYYSGVVDFFDHQGTTSMTFTNNIIDGCEGFGFYLDYYGGWPADSDYFKFNNNTLMNITGNGLVLDCGADYKINNNIFLDITGYGVDWDDPSTFTTESLEINNCLFDDIGTDEWDFAGSTAHPLVTNDNLINTNPLLDTTTYTPTWTATAKSPCINSGNPDTDDDQISWLTDEDDQDITGTQLDIGAVPYTNNVQQNIYTLSNDEVKYFSVPALYNPASTTHSYNTWDNVFNVFNDNDLLEEVDFEEMKWKWNDDDISITPNESYTTFKVCSQYGYKIKYDYSPTSSLPFEYDGFLPGSSLNAGMYLTSESRYTTKLYILAPEENEPNCSQSGTTGVWEREIYLGYYLEESLNPFDALQPVIDDITAIYAEDWGMSRTPVPGYIFQTGDEPHDAYTDHWVGRTESDAEIAINYGDMVVVKYIGTSDAEFKWGGVNPNPPYIDQYKRVMPTHFGYEEQLDYMPIYIDIDMDEYEEGEKPVEVAVFVANDCKGAAVIKEGQVQLNAYVLTDSTTALNDMTFQFWFPTKGVSKKVQQYQVYNPLSGKYVQDIATVIDYSDFLKVSFNSKDFDEGTEIPRIASLKGNYPNPFNPTTTIQFDIAKNGNAKLEIFNIKGQKVKTLVNEEMEAGSYNIKWHGDNDNDESMASGVYFSRLTTSGKALTSKMLLLK